MTLRVRIALNHTYSVFYHRQDWSVLLGTQFVRWFPASWSLSERKERECFQAAIHNIPDSMTTASLVANGNASPILTSVNVRAFKLIQLPNKSRKLVGYFATWNDVQQARLSTPTWADENLEWVRHFSPSYNRKQQTGTAKVSTSGKKGSGSKGSGANSIPVSSRRTIANRNQQKSSPGNCGSGQKKTYAAAASTTKDKANTDLKKTLLKLLASMVD